jgi:MoaA/NifB/PqqE/SkfB family radical SAM enzyme
MLARSRDVVHLRPEAFGAAAYVADRDDIFLLDKNVTQLLSAFTSRWRTVPLQDHGAVERLGGLGILDVKREKNASLIEQRSYCGVHLLGEFPDIPLVSRPLLVNCFATAWCPLQCVYCHADDLMGEETRMSETAVSVDCVASTASCLQSLVYVVTGGDPLTRPLRATRLVEQIPNDSGVVIDTSGVGCISDAVNLLKIRPMHLRVSIDSMDPRINKKTRPTNPKLRNELNIGDMQSLDMAARLIDECGRYACGVTVQTVISSKNDKVEHLLQFRDWLVSRGVRNWVLHTAINAGAARRFSIRSNNGVSPRELSSRKNTTILPDRAESARAIRQLVDSTVSSQLPIDIRCTDANTAPNSVFLIGSEGALYTQGRGPDGGRKVKLFESGKVPTAPARYWTYVSCLDHVQRYLNYVPLIHGASPTGLRFIN